MAISRQKKEQLVDEYVELLTNSQAVVFADYRGLSVHKVQELRGRMREQDARLQVVKNTLLELALKRAEMPVPADLLVGPTAIAYMPDDVSSAIKVIFDFAKDSENLKVKGAILEGQVLDAEAAKGLRDLPSRSEVLARLLGALQGPASELVRTIEAPAGELYRTLQAPMRELALTIQAYAEKGAEAGA